MLCGCVNVVVQNSGKKKRRGKEYKHVFASESKKKSGVFLFVCDISYSFFFAHFFLCKGDFCAKKKVC